MDEQKQPSTPQPKPTHQPGTGKGEHKTKEEGKQSGREDTGTTGANRPAGKSTAKDSTGVNPENPTEPESPHMPAP